MKAGIAALLLSYVLSQFFRAFLPVLAPMLQRDLGASPADLSLAAGIWFVVFAAMQIPIGSSLDRFGPRRTATLLFGAGGIGGTVLFATATTPLQIVWAMALIGVGCAPVLMASYFIFARVYPATVFATLAGAMIGAGSLGNIAGSLPLAWAAEALGWRGAMWAVVGMVGAVTLALGLLVRDPPHLTAPQRGSVLDLIRMPALWPIFAIMAVNYIPAATIRSLWAGPYVADVFAAGPAQIGQVTLVMGLAMIAGAFAYGPLDRMLKTRKWVILGGNALGGLALVALILWGAQSLWTATLLFAVVGFMGSSYGLIIAHARAFMPAHLTGRGVTLLNLLGIGGAGLAQLFSGRLFGAVAAPGSPAAPYDLLFALFAGCLALGLLAYLFSSDRTD